MNILKVLKKGYVNKKDNLGFDVETHQYDDSNGELNYIRQDFLMASIVGDDNFISWDKEEFGEYLLRWKHEKRLLWATNLDFDFRFTYQDTEHWKDFHKVITDGRIIYARHKHKDIRFMDTLAHHPVSVKELGNIVGLPKLPHPRCFLRKPVNNQEKKELIDYNIRDSMITKLSADYLKDFYNHLGCKMKITVASSGLDNWRRSAQPYDIFREKRYIIKKHYEGSLKGGRTEVIKRGYIKKGYCYDYNSHYPAVCMEGIDGTGSYPDPNSVRYTSAPSIDLLEFEGITRVKINVPYAYLPFIGQTIGGKYKFPYGVLDGWFTNIELRKAIENGARIIRLKEMIYYKTLFRPFRKIVQGLYDQRQKLKKEGNSMQQMVKTLMNSALFGKFAQRLTGYEEELDPSQVFMKDNGVFYQKKKDKSVEILSNPTFRDGMIYNVDNTIKKIPNFTLPILSSYTTALARLKLTQEMNRHKKHVLYCDTDSIFTLKECFDSSDKLGRLKLEYSFKDGIFVRPKYYIVHRDDGIKAKIKGVHEKITDYDSFGDLLKGKKVFGSTMTKSRSGRVRKLPYGAIIETNKSLTCNDDKRLWSDSFNPDEMQDSEPLEV